MISAIYVTLQALRHRERGSLTLALGTTVLSITALHDMALSQGIGLDFELFPFGQIVFVLAAATLISIRYAYIFDMISHLSQELSKMVPIHVIERIQAGEQLESCMPVGEAEAVVLVFDIVGSSKLQSPEFRLALEACMGQLHERIHKGYNPDTLEACAYRLKEMGDGLICTVGFPYLLPEPKQMEEVAVELAEDLCLIFHRAMASYSPQQEIYCGIGLVKGKIEGFFPSSGPSIYDLRGYPIVLATRYEAMRNLVYKKNGRTGSVLFIHDNVYQKLLSRSKEKFQLWDTSIADQAIRDDKETKQAWFCVIPYT
jgi:class 3 adenylate cyclase